MAEFMPGLDLNRLFFQQVIKPLMDKNFPGLRYSAGILGDGSDVLRFDTPLSMDHNWGPHMRIFLTEHDFKTKKEEIDKMFRHNLPYEFMGFPTNFSKPVDTYLVQQMKPIDSGPVNHLIQFYTVKSFFKHYLGVDPYARLTDKDWLLFPQHSLIEVTGGEVYYDGLGELEKVRKKFSYYPDHIWLYMYMMQWAYIGMEEAFMGRTGEIGDELGSHRVASNLVNHIMRLCFLMEKRYWPYEKWFGTAFSRLKSAHELHHILIDVIHGQTWQEREEHLTLAYEIIARLHNDLKITKPVETVPREFEGRPYKVLYGYEVVKEIKKKVKPKLQNMKYPLGSLDQFIGHPKIGHENYVYREMKNIIK